MKDPYHSSLNSYEVLNVHQTASKDEIQSAFRKALAGKNRSKATKARQKLLNNVDRAIEDFYIYESADIENATPTSLLEEKVPLR